MNFPKSECLSLCLQMPSKLLFVLCLALHTFRRGQHYITNGVSEGGANNLLRRDYFVTSQRALLLDQIYVCKRKKGQKPALVSFSAFGQSEIWNPSVTLQRVCSRKHVFFFLCFF